MAEREIKTIVSIETQEAYTNINEIKAAIAEYRKEVNEASIADGDLDEKSRKLAEAQEALKEVTNAMTQSQQKNIDITNLGQYSYQELAKQMGALKAEWRSTTDEVKRDELATQINTINNRLKDLDASTGNFQRNVGDYANGVKKGLDAFKNGLGASGKAMENVNKVASGLAANPLMATMGILVQAFMQLTASLKESDEGMEAINQASAMFGKLLEPVRKIVSFLGQKLLDIIEWVTPFMPKVMNFLGNVVGKMAGVGNALVQFILTPVRSLIASVRGLGKIIGDIIKGDFKSIGKDAKAMGGEIGDAFKKGFSVKANFQKGEEVTKNFLSGASSKRVKTEAEEKGKEVGESFAEGLLKEFNKALAEAIKKNDVLRKWEEEEAKFTADIIKESEAELAEDLAQTWDAEDEAFSNHIKSQMDAIKARKDAEVAFYNSSLDLMGAMANAIEASDGASAKHAGVVKALRASEAIIDTISGAVGAFMGITKSTGGWGIAAATTQAAAVLASGYAQVRKILSTDTSGASSPSVGGNSFGAVSAPSIDYTPTTTARATSASDIARLNEAKGDQRVVLVYSDVQNASRRVAVQESESSFK